PNCNRPICWETYTGQTLYRLTLIDLFVGIFVVVFIQTPRRLLVVHAPFGFVKAIGRQQFDIFSRVLDLVYSQAVCWLGMFFCPFIPVITCVKYILVFYLQKFALLKNCVPSSTPYRA